MLFRSVVLSLAVILPLSIVTDTQAQRTMVDNPMLSSSPVRYGGYSSSKSSHSIQSTPIQTALSSKKSKTSTNSTKSAHVGMVNINSATENELITLPGIGPSKARAIAEYRRQHGGFKSVDELQEVKGIGPATLEKLKAHLTF
jgi:comEA protein